MHRWIREFFEALRFSFGAFRSQFRKERHRQDRMRWLEKVQAPTLLPKPQDWPPESFGPNFGNATKARPKHGIQQDQKLIDAVEQALVNGKKCHACGHDTGDNTWTPPRSEGSPQ